MFQSELPVLLWQRCWLTQTGPWPPDNSKTTCSWGEGGMLLAGIDHSHRRQGVVLLYSGFLMKKLSEEKKNVEGFYLMRNQSKQAHIALIFRAVGTTPALVSSHIHSQVRAIESFMPALCFFCKWGPLRALLKKSCLQPPEYSANPENQSHQIFFHILTMKIFHQSCNMRIIGPLEV